MIKKKHHLLSTQHARHGTELLTINCIILASHQTSPKVFKCFSFLPFSIKMCHHHVNEATSNVYNSPLLFLKVFPSLRHSSVRLVSSITC